MVNWGLISQKQYIIKQNVFSEFNGFFYEINPLRTNIFFFFLKNRLDPEIMQNAPKLAHAITNDAPKRKVI